MTPAEVEQQVRSAARLAWWALLALTALTVLVVIWSHRARPQLAPCPPAQCRLAPHPSRTVAP